MRNLSDKALKRISQYMGGRGVSDYSPEDTTYEEDKLRAVVKEMENLLKSKDDPDDNPADEEYRLNDVIQDLKDTMDSFETLDDDMDVYPHQGGRRAQVDPMDELLDYQDAMFDSGVMNLLGDTMEAFVESILNQIEDGYDTLRGDWLEAQWQELRGEVMQEAAQVLPPDMMDTFEGLLEEEKNSNLEALRETLLEALEGFKNSPDTQALSNAVDEAGRKTLGA